MKWSLYLLLMLSGLLASGCRQSSRGSLPAGWAVMGSSPRDYAVSVIPGAHGHIVSIKDAHFFTDGFGAAARTTPAGPYRHRRLQLSAVMTTQSVASWATMWMRVDGRKKALAFDNMNNRRLSGTTGERTYSITLDVPADAESIVYGVMLNGRGSATMKQIVLREVGREVPSTDLLPDLQQRSKPCNCKADL